MSCKIIKEDIECCSFAEYAYTPAHMYIHTEEMQWIYKEETCSRRQRRHIAK